MPTDEQAVPRGEIIVCIAPEAMAAVSPDGELAPGQAAELSDVLGDTARLVPLFSERQGQLRRDAASRRAIVGAGVPDLSRFYRLATDDIETRRAPEAIVRRLDELPLVETAYFKPPHERAERPGVSAGPPSGTPPAVTPDFTGLQGYLGPAPAGIDAQFAWSGPGGFGDDVEIIDIENAWRFTHEDLLTNQGGVLNSAPDNLADRNHGTAVAGILSGDFNTFGITGICPGARIRGISVEGEPGGSSAAIRQAADRLRPGDIILIEDHTAGPVTVREAEAATTSATTAGYVPIEIWPDDFAAVKYATDAGVIVVSAAGNGDRELDVVDDLARSATGKQWANPFDREEADSGAIFAGAGAAPGGAEPDRSRLSFSNWGTCLDAQGWGERVVTTGGVRGGPGDLQGGPYEDRWYTRSFNGTSSAAPMVAGALACVQGVLRAAGLPPLSPRQARAILRISGSPQVAAADGSLKRIGSRPNLRELIPRALMFTGGPEALEGDGSYGGCPGVTIVCGCGGGPGYGAWDGPRWGGPRWGGPRWGGPRWGGPRWGGPRWGGPRWGGPSWADQLFEDPFGAADPPDPGRGTRPRHIRRPGFSG